MPPETFTFSWFSSACTKHFETPWDVIQHCPKNSWLIEWIWLMSHYIIDKKQLPIEVANGRVVTFRTNQPRTNGFCFLTAKMWQPGAEDLRGVTYAPALPCSWCSCPGLLAWWSSGQSPQESTEKNETRTTSLTSPLDKNKLLIATDGRSAADKHSTQLECEWEPIRLQATLVLFRETKQSTHALFY